MFAYLMPTQVVFGRNCIREKQGLLQSCGMKAMVITGRHSAKASGALEDILDALTAQHIKYVVFDKIESNPSVETVRTAAAIGRQGQVDFVIGIGGGSPMDAAKAIALLIADDLDDKALFSNQYNRVLPIIAVPTTAGTGSEVTQYAILTNKKAGTKIGIASPKLFPVIAFADPRYTESLSIDTTINTTVDALSHAIEGYVAKRSTPISDALAEESLQILSTHLGSLRDGISHEAREDLLYASTLAGIVIAQAGTTIVHGMGYSLTYHLGVDHGRANGLLLPAYLTALEEVEPIKIATILERLELADSTDFSGLMQYLLQGKTVLTDSQCADFAKEALRTKSVDNTPLELTEERLKELYATLQ